MYVLALVLATVVLAASWHCRQAACLVLAALAAWYLYAVVPVPAVAACLYAAEQHRLAQAGAPRSVVAPVRQVAAVCQ